MASTRTGTYGSYVGSLMGLSEPLTSEEMNINAKYIYSYLTAKGWTINAIAGMLGNMQAESSLNPGRWQSDNVNNMSGGFGLVQWTPATNYIEWASSNGCTDYTEMDWNLARIIYELENELQWISRSDYSLSFKDFSKSSEPISYLAKAFLLCYERPADQSTTVQDYRSSLASEWYSYLKGVNVSEPSEPIRKVKKFNFILFKRQRRLRYAKR